MTAETPWQAEGRYFTSPWNHLEESRAGLGFPSRVKFHDVTLRDGEQQAGIALTRGRQAGDRAAARRRRGGSDRGRHADRLPTGRGGREVDRRGRTSEPEIFAFARCMVDDIHKAKECGVDRGRRRDPLLGPHHRARVRLAARACDRPLDRGHPGGQGGGPLHGLLHDRLVPRRVRLVPRPGRAGRHRGPHGRARARRHLRRRHAAGDPGLGREGPRAAPRHVRSRRTSTTISGSPSRTRSRRSPPASRSSTRRLPGSASGPGTRRWRSWRWR